jgi:hypothetical protein
MGKAKRGKQKRKRYWWVNLVLAGLVAAGLGTALILSGDGGSSGLSSQITSSGDRFETVAAGEMPSFARRPSSKIREAYRYAAAHPDVLQYIPCTCGCRNTGHRHNGDCYVKERHEDGRITFTSHAAT